MEGKKDERKKERKGRKEGRGKVTMPILNSTSSLSMRSTIPIVGVVTKGRREGKNEGKDGRGEGR